MCGPLPYSISLIINADSQSQLAIDIIVTSRTSQGQLVRSTCAQIRRVRNPIARRAAILGANSDLSSGPSSANGSRYFQFAAFMVPGILTRESQPKRSFISVSGSKQSRNAGGYVA